MDDMESRIKHLEDMNERLTSEMKSLKALNERLLSENASLRSGAGAARSVVPGARGPAESIPQQKEGPPAALGAARLLLAMYLLSQTYSHTSTPKNTLTLFKASQNPSSKKLMEALQERLQT